MKNFTKILILWFTVQFVTAQDKIYVHRATSNNITGIATIINHPELNGNPNAKVVFCHAGIHNGTHLVPNPNPTGLWYSTTIQKWLIYNDNLQPMVPNSGYNVYIAGTTSSVFTHTASTSNSSGNTTALPSSIGNGDYIFISNYLVEGQNNYNPNFSGSYFSTSNNTRRIYFENPSTPMLINAAYRVLLPVPNTTTNPIILTTHQSTSANISSNYTIISHPNLNNNPNATFLIHHYYGFGSTSTYNVYSNYQRDLFYNATSGRWQIWNLPANQDMPSNMYFDIVIAPQDPLSLSTTENNADNQAITIYPNPVDYQLNFEYNGNVLIADIYNLMGQKVFQYNYQNNNSHQINKSLDVNELSSGVYLLQIKTEDGQIVNSKFIKK